MFNIEQKSKQHVGYCGAMLTRCAWCGAENDGSSADTKSDMETSHGICAECEFKLLCTEGGKDPAADTLT